MSRNNDKRDLTKDEFNSMPLAEDKFHLPKDSGSIYMRPQNSSDKSQPKLSEPNIRNSEKDFSSEKNSKNMRNTKDSRNSHGINIGNDVSDNGLNSFHYSAGRKIINSKFNEPNDNGVLLSTAHDNNGIVNNSGATFDSSDLDIDLVKKEFVDEEFLQNRGRRDYSFDDLSSDDIEEYTIGGAAYQPHDEELQQLIAIEENPYFSPEQKEVMAARVRADYAEQRRLEELNRLRKERKSKKKRSNADNFVDRDYVYTDRLRAIHETAMSSVNRELSRGQKFLNRLICIILSFTVLITLLIAIFINMTSYQGGRAIANSMDFDRYEIYEAGEYQNLKEYIYYLVPSYLRFNINGGDRTYFDALELAGLRPYISEFSRLMIQDVLSDTNVVSEQGVNLLEAHFLDKLDIFASALQVDISSGDLSWLLQQYTINNIYGPDWKNGLSLNESVKFVRLSKILNEHKDFVFLACIFVDLILAILLFVIVRPKNKYLNYLTDSVLYTFIFLLILYILPTDFYLRFSFSSNFIFTSLMRAGKYILLRYTLGTAAVFVLLWAFSILYLARKKRKNYLKID